MSRAKWIDDPGRTDEDDVDILVNLIHDSWKVTKHEPTPPISRIEKWKRVDAGSGVVLVWEVSDEGPTALDHGYNYQSTRSNFVVDVRSTRGIDNHLTLRNEVVRTLLQNRKLPHDNWDILKIGVRTALNNKSIGLFRDTIEVVLESYFRLIDTS